MREIEQGKWIRKTRTTKIEILEFLYCEFLRSHLIHPSIPKWPINNIFIIRYYNTSTQCTTNILHFYYTSTCSSHKYIHTGTQTHTHAEHKYHEIEIKLLK